jgi:hypothetical protein
MFVHGAHVKTIPQERDAQGMPHITPDPHYPEALIYARGRDTPFLLCMALPKPLVGPPGRPVISECVW